jgi:transposase
MDRGLLEGMLAQGLSLAEIGRRVGRHESTVAYWLEHHGLRAAKADLHAARGAIGREELATLVEEGLSIAQIAARLGRSKATVRHWLRRYGMRTANCREGCEERTAARAAGLARVTLQCERHGASEFVLEGRGYYRCVQCRAASVSRRRRAVRATVVEEAGGACVLCGYDRCIAALAFHHLDPTTKSFGLSQAGVSRSLARAREEAEKCVLLCANCHAEVEAGLTDVGEPVQAALQCTSLRVTPG